MPLPAEAKAFIQQYVANRQTLIAAMNLSRDQRNAWTKKFQLMIKSQETALANGTATYQQLLDQFVAECMAGGI